MNDKSDKKPKPPADDPLAPEQTGIVGAVWQMLTGMMPGGPPAPSQGARQDKKPAMRGSVLSPQQAQTMISQLFKLTVDVANGMWRIRRRMQSDAAQDGDDRLRGLSRHVESTWSAFAQHGLEIRDHTGEKYVAGMAMSVVAYQSTPGITFEKVLETVRPSIYFQDQLIQRGEVIVATPESMPEMDEPAPAAETPPASGSSGGSAARPIPVPDRSGESPAADGAKADSGDPTAMAKSDVPPAESAGAPEKQD